MILVQDFHLVTSLADIGVAVETHIATVVTETSLHKLLPRLTVTLAHSITVFLTHRGQEAILVQDFHPVTSLADIGVAVETHIAIVVTETSLRGLGHTVVLHGVDDFLLHQGAVLREVGSGHSVIVAQNSNVRA